MRKKVISFLLAIISSPTVLAAPKESIQDKSLDLFIAETIEQVIQVALNEEGYLEKASNYELYEKTTNVGLNNFTKYANDLAIQNFYTGNKNGFPWCDVFVDWCFCSAFGVEIAKTITYQVPYGSAGCEVSASYFQQAGQFYSTPMPGDQIFFSSSHTGLVYKVDGNTVYTIEGNTNSSNEIVNNGGAVAVKSYELNNSRISGYGRPNYLAIAQQRYNEHHQLYLAYLEEQRQQEIKENLTSKHLWTLEKQDNFRMENKDYDTGNF